ncbi:MAG: TonB-dependent receptor [Acidobacteria bacterium]|nr:TonB-dependent receptor [Acidobacteriota bacterium]
MKNPDAPFKTVFTAIQLRRMIVRLFVLVSIFSCMGMIPNEVLAQATTGAVQGQVIDPSGAVVVGASVALSNPITTYKVTTQTDTAGAFKFFSVPFNTYKIRVEAKGFAPAEQTVDVHSAVPANVSFSLTVELVTEEVTVTADTSQMIEPDRVSADTDLNTSLLIRQLGTTPSRGLEKMIESVPGVVADDNGRIHPRGSESNVQTVINGIPVTDNLSAVFSTSFDPRTASHVEVITGSIPAEFGDKLGAVVNLTTKSGLDMPISGEISGNIGSFVSGDAVASFGGHLQKFGWHTSFSGSTTHRYLDSPRLENFHNVGRSASNLTTLDYNPTANDFLKLTLIVGGANFQVPNRLEQERAGQDQRQQQRNHSESLSWQHLFSQTILSDVSIFYRTATAKLNSNPLSTPVAALQDRRLTNYGFISSMSYSGHGHTFKTGLQYTRTPVREDFSFYPTDPTAFEPITDEMGNEVPNPVLQFSAAHPFIFHDRRLGRRWAAFVQDRFSPIQNLTLDLGLRFDDYKLLISEHAFSPRVGLAYYIPRTQTVFRLSYNRLFQPPPAENLLLASSVEAARLSPLAVQSGQPGVNPVLPDKEHVFEAGFQQQLTGFARLTVSVYNKQIRNFADKDQFFDTGVIFPISIFAGRVTGVEARIDTAEWRGLSGFISYANSRSFGITPINGGLFLGEAVESLQNPGFRFPNDHDERNAGQFQVNYSNKKTGWWASFGGRYDSGLPVDVEPGTTRQQFVEQGFDPRLFDEIDFQRGRVRPRTILNFSTGIDLFQKEHVQTSLALDVQNLTDKLFLYNFESVFSGTHIGPPRLWSGRLTFRFR